MSLITLLSACMLPLAAMASIESITYTSDNYVVVETSEGNILKVKVRPEDNADEQVAHICKVINCKEIKNANRKR